VIVELLVVPNCPNEAIARDVLGVALEQASVEAAVTVTVIESDDEAQRRRFVGSPTFLIDGVDPFSGAGAPGGLTCRLYETVDGLAAVPTVGSLRDALSRARVD